MKFICFNIYEFDDDAIILIKIKLLSLLLFYVLMILFGFVWTWTSLDIMQIPSVICSMFILRLRVKRHKVIEYRNGWILHWLLFWAITSSTIHHKVTRTVSAARCCVIDSNDRLKVNEQVSNNEQSTINYSLWPQGSCVCQQNTIFMKMHQWKLWNVYKRTFIQWQRIQSFMFLYTRHIE